MSFNTHKQVKYALNALYGSMDSVLIEYRILKARKRGTVSGYFDDLDKLAELADNNDSSGNSYIVINPVNPELKGRSYNKLTPFANSLTVDAEVPCRRYILIDFDPKRPSGMGSNDAEHKAALKRAKSVCHYLQSHFGFPDMFRADSGNGAHVLVPCDFPNEPKNTELIKKFLLAMKSMAETDIVTVDTAVYNASRLTRLYGTLNRKGDNIPERPYRYSKLLYVPDEWIPVSQEAIEQVIEASGINDAASKSMSQRSTNSVDLKAFIEKHEIEVCQIEEEEDRTTYHLAQCPFNPEHKAKDSALFQFVSGAVGFKCFHDSCRDKAWRDVKKLFGGDDQEFEEECAAFERSDMGNGYRIIKRHGHTFRYVADTVMWHIWNDRYWEPDREKKMLDLAGKTAELIKSSEAATIPPDCDEEGNEDWSNRNAHITFGIRSENVGRRKSMLESAGSDERIRSIPEKWDTDPWLLCVANGVIELNNNCKLRPHCQDDRITRMIDVPYEPDAKCPLWFSFLKRVLPNKEERRFVQKFVGYCLTGSTREHCFLFLYGEGRNGKSTLVDTVSKLLAPYHFHASVKAIMQDDRQGDNYTLAELPGMRLLTFDELGAQDILNEAMIKNMTGGDRIACRHPFGRPFSYIPQFKAILYGNHKPTIVGTDKGIWERPRFLPFTEIITREERIDDLNEKLEAEFPGILAWAVRGCIGWQEEGLQESDSMKHAIQEYRADMDVFQQFIDDCMLVTDRDLDVVGGQQIYDHYRYWCERSGHRPASITKFAEKMKRKGFKKKPRTNKGNFWIGFQIRQAEDTEGIHFGLEV